MDKMAVRLVLVRFLFFPAIFKVDHIVVRNTEIVLRRLDTETDKLTHCHILCLLKLICKSHNVAGLRFKQSTDSVKKSQECFIPRGQ